MSDNAVILSPEERIKIFGDKLISSSLGGGNLAKANRHYLFGNAMTDLFSDEVYIIYSMLYHFKDRYISIDSEFVKLWLLRNQTFIDDASSRRKIDINAYGEVDDSVTLGYIGGVIKYFEKLSKKEKLSEDDFKLTFEKYLIEFESFETSKVYSNAMQILRDGLKIGRKTLQGVNDSNNYIKANMARIEGLVDRSQGVGFIFMEDVILSPNEATKSYKVADFGDLTELNEHYRGIFTGNLYTVFAPSKSGKSKFCARIAHTAMVKFGNNVSVWAFEGGFEAWTAEMRAIHFDYTYNQGVSALDVKSGITKATILQDTLPKDSELRELEAISSMDLISNESYGSLHYIERPFLVETFLDEIATSIKANNSQVLIIDYLQLIQSERNKAKQERISDAYPKLLDFCKKNNVAVISPAQYKQSVVDELNRLSEDEDKDMRTAGGESYEIYKSSDVIFSLWASPADLLNNHMTILPMPTRLYPAIPKFDIYVDLGTCQFISKN